MKTLFTAILAFFLAFSTFAQDREQRHSTIDLFKNIPIEDECQPALFLFYDDVQVEPWDNKYIRIETTVHALNFSETLLQYLVESGRYNIEIKDRPEDGTKVISMPKRELVIMKKNADMEEFLSIHVYVPKNLIWQLLDPRINLSL